MNDQEAAEGVMAIFAGMGLIWLAILVVGVVSGWVIFTKAGKPGWAAIVPIYNIIVLLEIVGRPIWRIVLFLVPVVNIVAPIIWIIVALDLAKSFGKGTGFGVGLAFLGIVFGPILAFGDSKYVGVAVQS